MSQTELTIINLSGTPVQVYLTLGATHGCVKNVAGISFVTNQVNALQGWFILNPGASASYTPPEGEGINGNFTFGSPPLNCPTTEYRNGINLAEFILNNSFQGPGAQETIDISCVPGANALIGFALNGGGPWNAGSTKPNVTQFANTALGGNTGLVGVYPCGCDECTSRFDPPQLNCPASPAPPAYEPCQSQPICNVQRDASGSGGTVEVSFHGFLPN